MVAITDDTGAVAATFAYTPFGEVLERTIVNPVCDIPIGFAGEYGVLCEPNGLYYMNARYYDPEMGRFLSEDPAGLGGGDLTLYSYAGNNPVVFVDPSGLCATSSGSDNYDMKRSPVGWGIFARSQGETYGWPYAHVLANAGIARDWGGVVAASFSLGKEFLDLGKGVLGNKESLYSAFQPIDFRMNAFGRQIGLEMRNPVAGETLKMRLGQFVNYPEGVPGPFYQWLWGNTPLENN